MKASEEEILNKLISLARYGSFTNEEIKIMVEKYIKEDIRDFVLEVYNRYSDELESMINEAKNEQTTVMAKKEFKIGETFQFGFVKLKCEVGHNRCDGCALFDIDYCENLCAFIGECDAKYRKDKTDVIFVKVEE